MIAEVTGVLLAGGKSKRMGEDKRFLCVGEQSLFERSLSVLREIFQEVRVVIAQDSPALEVEVPISCDLIPNGGSLGGLYTGLKQATTQHIFLAACDMPFLNANVIRYMSSLKDEADIIIGQWGTRFQPTHAVYSRRCLPIIEEMLYAGNMKIQQMVAHPSLHVRLVEETELVKIDPTGRSFLNVNTPSDLQAARALIDGSVGI